MAEKELAFFFFLDLVKRPKGLKLAMLEKFICSVIVFELLKFRRLEASFRYLQIPCSLYTDVIRIMLHTGIDYLM